MLLEHGADPYKQWNNGLIWQLFLNEIKEGLLKQHTDSELIKYSHIIQAFLHYGSQRATGTSSIYHTLHNSVSLRLIIDDVFSMRLPKEASAIQHACGLFTPQRRGSASDENLVSTKRLRPD
jgi:6-phosphogluconate dehydrogenase